MSCRIGRPTKCTPEVAAACREYLRLKAAGNLTRTWISVKAGKLGLHSDTLRRYVREAEEAAEFEAIDPRRRAAKGLSHFDHEAAKRGPGSRTIHASKWEAE